MTGFAGGGLSRNMKTTDLEPPFNPVLSDDAGVPYNLTAATSIKVTATRAGASVFASRACTGSALGVVNMPWVSGDLNTAGEVKLEVEVEWASGRVQRFPAVGAFSVVVTAKL